MVCLCLSGAVQMVGNRQQDCAPCVMRRTARIFRSGDQRAKLIHFFLAIGKARHKARENLTVADAIHF